MVFRFGNKKVLLSNLNVINLGYYKFFTINDFPTQNLLPDVECKICKYKPLIIIVYTSNQGG